MAEDDAQRTESATPRRREEVRKRGQVARSIEVNSALILLTFVICLKIFGPFLYYNLSQIMIYGFNNAHLINVNTPDLTYYFIAILIKMFWMLLPIIGVVFLVGLVSNFLQVGFVLSIHPIIPSLNKINPLTGFSRIFSARSAAELIKSILKILIVGYIAYSTIRSEFNVLIPLMDMDIKQSSLIIASLSYEIILKIAIALLIMALFDYGYQRWEFEKSIRMTKQEIKDEYKQLEGDPLIRLRIRQRQREIARRRMMMEVPKADVVITNPAHIAVAIRYDKDTMKAPQVIAKGMRLIAEKIKEIALSCNIPIVENPPLAQILYKTVDIGEEIPPQLYKVVAEILAFVYRLKDEGVSS